jgi:putative ABC transport system permease protein
MPLITLILKNIWSKKARSIGIAFAISIAVMTVVTLTVVSSSLESSAAAVLTLGKADFTVAQNGVSEILYSSLDEGQLQAVRSTPGVKSAVGVLLETQHLSADTPLFIEIGLPPDELASFGVTVVAGRPFGATASHQVMLGWRAAQNFGLHVGDRFSANGTWNTVVGIYSTGISYGDLGAMFPLTALQAYNRVPGAVTLIFVNVEPGASISSVEKAITTDHPEVTTIRTAEQFGRADRNLVFLQAAATGSTILAILIGAVIVGNTMLLSLFERTREFGLLRAIGWTRRRVVALVVGEGIVLALVGALLGVALSFAAAGVLERLPQLRGVLQIDFTKEAFWRAVYTGLGMAVIGALYPALRAANLTPLKALSHE